LDGIGIFDVSGIKKRLQEATIPLQGMGNFDVVRSDLGEVLAMMVLEQEYGTQFAYKSVRDREVCQLAGRGIDAIGIENAERLTLLIGEAKVSAESGSIPKVVDRSKDSLSKQLKGHMKAHTETGRKLWDIVRRTTDANLQSLFITAALYWEEKCWDKLAVVCCATLVRPKSLYKRRDFGSLWESPEQTSPASVRFLILCVQESIDNAVKKFYEAAMLEG
jgi:hypothetical protein